MSKRKKSDFRSEVETIVQWLGKTRGWSGYGMTRFINCLCSHDLCSLESIRHLPAYTWLKTRNAGTMSHSYMTELLDYLDVDPIIWWGEHAPISVQRKLGIYPLRLSDQLDLDKIKWRPIYTVPLERLVLVFRRCEDCRKGVCWGHTVDKFPVGVSIQIYHRPVDDYLGYP